jgi:hypothetical protein
VSGICYIGLNEPNIEAERSEAQNIFARPNTGIIGSNPTWDMNVCPRDFCVYIVLCSSFFFQFLGVGWDWFYFVHRPLFGLLYQPRMIDDDECESVAGIRIGRGNRSTRRKPAPAPLCPPQIPHNLTWAWTRAAAVATRRLTVWAMARPCCPVCR